MHIVFFVRSFDSWSSCCPVESCVSLTSSWNSKKLWGFLKVWLDDPTSSSGHPTLPHPTDVTGAFGMVLCPCCEIFLKTVHRYETPRADRAFQKGGWAAKPDHPEARTNLVTSFVIDVKANQMPGISANTPKMNQTIALFYTVDYAG